MSHTYLSHAKQLLIVPCAILIALATSTPIAKAQSPTSERALMNQTPSATHSTDTASPVSLDGNRALLNHSVGRHEGTIVADGSEAEARALTAESALLGTVASSKRRIVLAW